VRTVADRTHSPLEAVIVEWLDRAVAEPALELLPDEQLLALCDGQWDTQPQEELSDLLARNQEGSLLPPERERLDGLMRIYRKGLVRKAQALHVAVARGLRPRLS
jgi:hypothetical protein